MFRHSSWTFPFFMTTMTKPYQRNILYAIDSCRKPWPYRRNLPVANLSGGKGSRRSETYIKKAAIVRRELFELWCHKASGHILLDMAIAWERPMSYRGPRSGGLLHCDSGTKWLTGSKGHHDRSKEKHGSY